MNTCPLTNHEVSFHLDQSTGKRIFYYDNPVLGKIRLTESALRSLMLFDENEKNIVKGLIRNNADNGVTDFVVTPDMTDNINDLEIPYDFEGRARHLLQYLYDHGGKEYKSFDMDSRTDISITYSSKDEFERIIKFLESEGFIKCGKVTAGRQYSVYNGLMLTKDGIKEIEKGLPKMPLHSLVDQKISTGDPTIDNRIEHARNLFFDPHPTIDKMRSACETLIFILEPLRKELDGMFSGDTDKFFEMVNQFSVRHNKERTKKIETPEQLEWIYYSLLNTINTYVKMKKRGKS